MDKQKKQIRGLTDVKKLKEELEESKKKYLRALADYHNLEKRINEGKEEIFRQTAKRVILRLLPFLDNLEKAEVFVKDQGLAMIKGQFIKALEEEGVREIEIRGQQFDPQLAEAVDVVDGSEDGKVAEVLRKGYKLGDQILRPAQVKVTKKK